MGDQPPGVCGGHPRARRPGQKAAVLHRVPSANTSTTEKGVGGGDGQLSSRTEGHMAPWSRRQHRCADWRVQGRAGISAEVGAPCCQLGQALRAGSAQRPWGRGWGSWWDRTGWRRQLRGPAAPPQLCRWPDLTGQGDATLDKGSVLATSSNGSIGHPGTAHSCTPAWRHDGRDTGRDAATHVQPGCSRPGLKEPLACPSSR